MYKEKETLDGEELYSPLKLLYSAYTDERPVVSQVMCEGFEAVDRYLSPLSEQDQRAVFQTFCKIYTENERLAFQAGLRTGFRLFRELEEAT